MVGFNFSPVFHLKEFPLSYHGYLGFRIKVKYTRELIECFLPFRPSEYTAVI